MTGSRAQGEWRDGAMEGLGVRVYKSGRLAAGRWARGALAEELAPAACAAAVQAADRAAQAARRVKVCSLGLRRQVRRRVVCTHCR